MVAITFSEAQAIINMLAPLSDCSIAEQWAVIWLLWLEGVKPSKIHRRMLAQHVENCTMQKKEYQWVEMFQSGRTSAVDEECSGCLTTSWTVDKVNDLMVWFKRTDRLLSLTQVTSWTSVVDLHIPSSTRAMGITKFVQGGCTSSLQMSTNGHCHMWWNMGVPLWNGKPMSKHGMETYVTAQDQEIQQCAFCWKSDVHAVLGL
jgi:hypothetical protein